MFESTNILAEAIGAVAVVLNFIGYRQQDVNRYRFLSGLALAAVSTHFFLLGDAEAAGIGCGLASIRNLVAMKYRGKRILAFFLGANIGFFFYEWFYLDSMWIITIAYISSLIFTVGSIMLSSAARMRQWFVLAELLGLTFAVLVGSIFGTIFNITNLLSISMIMISDHKKKPRQ